MKLAFLISSSSAGLGGHYRSLRSLVEALQNNGHECTIVVWSHSENGAPPIEAMECHSVTVFPRWVGYHRLLRRFNRDMAWFAPDAVHCFDHIAFFHAVTSGLACEIPTVMTKCGGPPFERPVPLPKTVVVFSQEDLSWFQRQVEYSSTEFHLIPARVGKVATNQDLCRELRNACNSDLVALRVARIGSQHAKSIRSSIELVKRLRCQGLDIRLAVVGTAESSTHLKELKAYSGEDAIFVSDTRFILEASQIISAADVVIGSGRGLMEAAAVGKPILATAANLEVPVLVGRHNVAGLLQYNFSSRYVSEKTNEAEIIAEVVECLTSTIHYDRWSREAGELFNEYFSIDGALQRYLDIYKSAEPLPYNRTQIFNSWSRVYCKLARDTWHRCKQLGN